MGRKLNVALLLAMHLGFFACAGLIVGPFLTDGVNQGGDTNIAVNQSKLGSEEPTDAPSQKNVAEVQLREEFSGQRNWLWKTFEQKRIDGQESVNATLRETRRPYVQRRTP